MRRKRRVEQNSFYPLLCMSYTRINQQIFRRNVNKKM